MCTEGLIKHANLKKDGYNQTDNEQVNSYTYHDEKAEASHHHKLRALNEHDLLEMMMMTTGGGGGGFTRPT